MSTAFDIKTVPEHLRVAFYGSIFAMALADGTMDRDEMALIFESLELDGMSEASKRTVRSYLIEPPQLADCLNALSHGSDELRFGVMVNLMDVALADGEIEECEQKVLEEARVALRITPDKMAAIEKFVREVKRIRERGLDDDVAAEALKRAASGLTAVGIPLAAVYFSGSVIGLSAAGITSGLAALGLGLGMVPGIGVAVLLGTAAYLTASWLFGKGKRRQQEELQAARERRAQLIIQNLQASIDDLAARVRELSEKAATADANREAIAKLTERMKALQKLLARRQAA